MSLGLQYHVCCLEEVAIVLHYRFDVCEVAICCITDVVQIALCCLLPYKFDAIDFDRKARAVAAERAARNLHTARPVGAASPSHSPSPDFSTLGDYHKSKHGHRIPRNVRATHGSSGQKPGDSLLNWLKQENESISQQQQRLLLDVSKPSSGGQWWHNSSLASSNKQVHKWKFCKTL